MAFTTSPEAAITLIRDRAKPKPAFRFDAARWVGQGAVFVHEGPEVFPGRGDDPKRVLRPDALPGDGTDDLPMIHAKHRVKAAAHAIATRQISGGLG